MKKMTMRKKQGGFVLSAELVMLVTILGLGMSVGLVSLRDAATAEMHDLAEAVGALDQSYAYNGMTNDQDTSGVEGSSWGDDIDTDAGDEVGFSFVDLDEDEGAAALTANVADAATAPTTGAGDLQTAPTSSP